MMSWLWLVFAAAAAEPSADVLAYPIGTGDMLQVLVVGEADMSGVMRVGADGAVDIPIAGRIGVEGLTVDEASRAITDYLGKHVLAHPQVVLSVQTYASRKVDVDGGVIKPATYPLEKKRTTVSDLLVRAGGLAEANAPRAFVFREVAGETARLEVDLERLNAGDPSADMELRAGDRLYIPPVESVFVDGQVQKPGAIAYRDGMTVTQAIAQAGSTSGTARKAGVYIMRGDERIPVNLKRILSGDQADIALRPSDRIYIPESVF
jgi:polysaccharide export outer membrane protein